MNHSFDTLFITAPALVSSNRNINAMVDPKTSKDWLELEWFAQIRCG
jgi:hypothetical protein